MDRIILAYHAYILWFWFQTIQHILCSHISIIFFLTFQYYVRFVEEVDLFFIYDFFSVSKQEKPINKYIMMCLSFIIFGIKNFIPKFKSKWFMLKEDRIDFSFPYNVSNDVSYVVIESLPF